MGELSKSINDKAKFKQERERAESFWRQAAKQGLKENASRHRASRICRA